MSVVYCRCAYAQVLPSDVKEAVLDGLCAAGAPFTAVPDLCEMSARRDPRLAGLAATPGLKIAACHPRAVRWLFHAAGSPLPENASIINLRELPADQALQELG
jgi:hypothetical protein